MLVKPLFQEYTSLLGEPAVTACMGALQANLEAWESQGNALISMGTARRSQEQAERETRRNSC